MTSDLVEMYGTRIAMSANLPYPMPIERKVFDCCGITGRFLFPRKATRYSYIRAIVEIENGMNLPYWFPNKMKEDGKRMTDEEKFLCRCACRRCTKQDEEECKTCEYNYYDKEGE